jgi:hypothetical protein
MMGINNWGVCLWGVGSKGIFLDPVCVEVGITEGWEFFGGLKMAKITVRSPALFILMIAQRRLGK